MLQINNTIAFAQEPTFACSMVWGPALSLALAWALELLSPIVLPGDEAWTGADNHPSKK